MKKNLKLVIIFLFISMIFINTASQISALDMTSKLETLASKASFQKQPNLAETIGQIVKGALSLLGVIFMLLVIYGGFLWMTAAGNEEQITKAKNILKASIIGLIIVIGAYAIAFFVVNQIVTATGYSAS
jgi:hypothetical protein